LLSSDSEFIYGTFVRSRKPSSGEYPTKWTFYTDNEGQYSWTANPIAIDRPKKFLHYNLFEALVYNPKIQLFIETDHMLDATAKHNRIQEVLPQRPGETDDRYRTRLKEELSKAVGHMTTRVQVNYRTVVPQIYNNKLQLLVPLSFDGGVSTPLVIPVTKRKCDHPSCTDESNPAYWEYHGATVLTTAMAYNNARLLCKVESEWLICNVSAADGGAAGGAAGGGAGAGAGAPTAGAGAPTMQSFLEMLDALKSSMSQTQKIDVINRMSAP